MKLRSFNLLALAAAMAITSFFFGSLLVDTENLRMLPPLTRSEFAPGNVNFSDLVAANPGSSAARQALPQ